MRQLEDIQILYAFHFDSLPNSEQETRARFLPRSLEFAKRRNQTYFADSQSGTELPRTKHQAATVFLLY